MSVITWCVIGLVLGVLAAPLAPSGRPLMKWMPPILIGVTVAMLVGWFGAITFQVGVNPVLEPASDISAAVGAAVILAAWVFGKHYRVRHPEPERRRKRAERVPRTPKRGPM